MAGCAGVKVRGILTGFTQVAGLSRRALALDHRVRGTVEFCDSGFVIMVAKVKAPSGPSDSQELRTPYSAPGPHGAHPPSHSAAGCQPASHFSAAGLFHPARLGRPLFFASAHLISLACEIRIVAHDYSLTSWREIGTLAESTCVAMPTLDHHNHHSMRR